MTHYFFVCKSITNSTLKNDVMTKWPFVVNESYQKIGNILNGTVQNFHKLKLLRSYIVKKASSVPQVSFEH